MANLLEVSELGVEFGGLRAVDGMDLHVAFGEAVAVIGPNGAGKTTLINAISGFAPVSSGVINFHDKELNRLKAHQRVRLGMARTFQNLELFESMTLRENLLSGFESSRRWGRIHRGRTEHSDAIGHVVAAFGLGVFVDAKVESLPYGVRKLSELARALIQRPKLLLLDEPAAGLSSSDKETLIRAVQSWRQRSGGSLVLIEHDMSLVRDLSERVVVMELGKEITQGLFEQVAVHPEVVRAYLGSSV